MAKFNLADFGHSRGRRDMERVGLFEEPSYLIGVPPAIQLSERGKGMQMITNGEKTKSGLPDCYFEKTPFKRLSEKDPYISVEQLERRKALVEAKKNLTAQFWPSSGYKQSSTSGDFYGTFGGRVDAFSRELRAKGAYKPQLPNVKTGPGKKGTYGYPDITINKFPEYKPEGVEKRGVAGDKLSRGRFLSSCGGEYFDKNPFRPVGPQGSLFVKRRSAGDVDSKKREGQHWYPPHAPKWPSNNHDGCFDEFPKHMPDPYGGTGNKGKGQSGGGKTSGVFYPPIHGSERTYYSDSVVNMNVDFRVNHKNWRYAQPFTFKDEDTPNAG